MVSTCQNKEDGVLLPSVGKMWVEGVVAKTETGLNAQIPSFYVLSRHSFTLPPSIIVDCFSCVLIDDKL